ncbi:MAG TPA: hypothetical protein VG102_00990 [Candidatus Paceibacterota bacterium]|jgi:hypothetical protein|nr:hypothetical protein [Candidatus Paceibacterota bacterium]
MTEIVLALIQQLNGAVIILVCIFLIVAFLLYKAGSISTMFGEFKTKNEKIDTKLEGMQASLSEIKATANLLYQAHLKTIGAGSPIKLLALGQEISNTLNVPEKINTHWEAISAEIAKKNPQNPYDIQTVSMAIAKSCFDTIFTEEERNEAKTVAFNKGVNLAEIYAVLGIEIRNRVMKERGLPLDEIDKHDPAKKKSDGTVA